MIWPTPYAMTTTLGMDGVNSSHVVLPVIPKSDRAQPDFQPPAKDPELPSYGELKVDTAATPDIGSVWSVVRKPNDSKTQIIQSGSGGRAYPWGSISYWREVIQTAQDDDPATSGVTGITGYLVDLGDRTVRLEGDLSLSSDAENFYFNYTRRALENGKLVKEKTWSEIIPRDHH